MRWNFNLKFQLPLELQPNFKFVVSVIFKEISNFCKITHLCVCGRFFFVSAVCVCCSNLDWLYVALWFVLRFCFLYFPITYSPATAKLDDKLRMPLVRSTHHVCTEGNRIDKSIGGCVVVHRHVEWNHVESNHIRTTTRFRYSLSPLCNIHANNGAYTIAEMQQMRTRWHCSTLLFDLLICPVFILRVSVFLFCCVNMFREIIIIREVISEKVWLNIFLTPQTCTSSWSIRVTEHESPNAHHS